MELLVEPKLGLLPTWIFFFKSNRSPIAIPPLPATLYLDYFLICNFESQVLPRRLCMEIGN